MESNLATISNIYWWILNKITFRCILIIKITWYRSYFKLMWFWWFNIISILIKIINWIKHLYNILLYNHVCFKNNLELFKWLLKTICIIKYFAKLRFYHQFNSIVSNFCCINKNKKGIINNLYLSIYIW